MKKSKNNNFIKYILKQIKNFYSLEIVSIFLTICFSLSVIITPYLTRYVIDLFSKNMNLSDVWFIILAFLLACFLQPIFYYFNTKIIKTISEKIILKLRCMFFNNVINAPFSFFFKNSSGSIISRLVNDSRQLGNFLSNSVTILFQNALFVILIFIGMFSLSKIITYYLFILLSLYVIFNLFLNKKFEKSSEKILKNNDDFYKVIKRSMDHIETIKTTRQEENTLYAFLKSAKNLYDNNLKLYNLHNLVASINATIEVFAIALIYVVGFSLISKGKLTIGSVVAFDVYFQMIIPSIKDLINFNSNYHEVVPVLKRLNEYFNITSEVALNSCHFSNEVPSICFDKVSFQYNDNPKTKKVLNCLSFNMMGKGLYGLTGKSGIGKSTVAKLMVGLYKPTEGKIKIDFGEKTASNVRDNIGYVSQNMKLFYDMTILYNITLGNQKISNEDVFLICKKLNLYDKISKLPNGYEELVTEKVNFSGGEVQRIILARIYLQKKTINILDEITSALDNTNTKNVREVVEEISKNSLVVLLTHDHSLLINAKQTLKLGGKKKNFDIK